MRCVLPCPVDGRGEELGRWIVATLQDGGWGDEGQICRLIHLLARLPARARARLLDLLEATRPGEPASEA